MNVSIGRRWEEFVEDAVRAGRYGSASEVVREGLRLVEEREARLAALRRTLDASIAEGGELDADDVAVALAGMAETIRARMATPEETFVAEGDLFTAARGESPAAGHGPEGR